MKKFYTLLAVALLTSVSMFAGEWVKPSMPVPTAIDFASAVSATESESTACYLYNVEYGGYYLGANAWGTRASLSKTAPMEVKIVEFNGKYGILKNGGTYASPDGVDGVWIDGTRKNYDQFVFALNGNQFTITCPPVGGDDAFLSCFADNSAVNPELNLATEAAAATAGTTLCKTWILVDIEATKALLSQETLDNYNKELARYNAAMDLKKAIDEAIAKYPTIDLAGPSGVYENTSSTTEELTAAKAAVQEAVVAAAEKSASVAAPQDMTSLIINPTFDVVNDFTGWKGSSFGAGGTTSTCAERYQLVFDTWQQIDNVPNGVYAINVDGFFRYGSIDEDYNATKEGKKSLSFIYGTNVVAEPSTCDTAETPLMTLFAGVTPGITDCGGTDFTAPDGTAYKIPNSMLDFTNFNNAGYYKTNTVLVPVTENSVKIGVKNATSTGWTIVDNFGLKFFGSGADAYNLLAQEYAKGASLPEGTIATKSLINEYNAFVASAKADNYAEYKEFVANVAAKKAVVDQNAAVWAEYVELAGMANTLIAEPAYREIAVELNEYLTYDYAFNLEDLVLTDEEIKAEIATLTKLYEDAKLLTPPGTDVSTMLKNTDFAKGEEGWTFEGKNNGGALAANASAKCAEGWNNSGFDIYQMVQNAPVGVYEIQTQGFYRYLRGDNAWNAYFNEDGTKRTEDVADYLKESPAYVYMNDNKTPLKNVFDESVLQGELYASTGTNGTYKDPIDTYWYPNDMADAGRAFDAGLYKVSAFGLVAKTGDPLRIGMKGVSNQGSDSWAIFTRFKLIFQGFDADIIYPELAKALAKLDMTSLQGKEVLAASQDIKAKAEAAYAAGEGKVMFDALAEVFAQNTAIDNSKKIFSDLQKSIENLEAALSDSQAADDVVGLAFDLDDEVKNAINSLSYTDADATAKIAEIEKIIKRLGIPASISSATQDNPVDLALIVNPSFEDNFNGWTKAGTATTQTQSNTSFNKAGTLYVESWHQAGTFDVSQKLDVADLNLPAGYYMLTATIHSEQEGSYIYFNNDTTFIGTSSDALAAADWSVVANVPAGGAMEIGVKSNLNGSTWLCIDNFRIAYLGETYDGIEKVMNTKEVNGAQSIYTLDGAKVATMRKGINIVRLSNGKVVKVLKY